MLHHDRSRRVALERWPTDEKLVEDDPERVDVAVWAGRLALRLFGRDVLDRSPNGARLRELAAGPGLGKAEVGNLRMVLFGQEDVLRFEVSVNQSPTMREGHARCDLNRQRDCGINGKRALCNQVGEGPARQEFHYDEWPVTGNSPETAEVVHLHEVWMRHRAG